MANNKPADLIGQRFGKLVVVERAKNNDRGNTMWKCKCDCGKEKIALGYDLTHGRTVSCGCKAVGIPSANRQDLVGKRFGTLTVVSVCKDKTNNGIVCWNCKCDCGVETIVRAGNLLSGHTTSHKGCVLRGRSYNFIDLTGERYGRLTVLSEHGKRDEKTLWLCKCDCGNTTFVKTDYLRRGKTRSCGCLLSDARKKPKHIAHGDSGTRLYKTYIGIHDRCSPTAKCSKHYFDKGVRVCDEWQGKDGYIRFREWSLKNGFDESKPWTEMTIDRINNDGNYEPSNCRWTTMKQQANNQSHNVRISYNGKTQTMKQWCEELNLSYGAIKVRHQKGIEPPELFAPIKHKVKK